MSGITDNPQKTGAFHVHSVYSIFDSAASPDEIVARAKELGYHSVSLTDHGTLLGIEPFMDAGRKYGVNTVPGVEAYLPGRTHLILIAKNYEGFQAISYAMRDANRTIERAGKRMLFPIMQEETLEKYFRGNPNVLASSACIRGPLGKILLEKFRAEKKAGMAMAEKESLQDAHQKYQEIKQELQKVKKKEKEASAYVKKLRRYAGEIFKARIQKEEKRQKNLKTETAISNSRKKILQMQMEREYSIKVLPSAESAAQDLEQKLDMLKKTAKELEKQENKFKKLENFLDSMEIPCEEELYQKARCMAVWLKGMFHEFYIELQYHGLEEERYVMPLLGKIAAETGIPVIAANDSHMVLNSEDDLEARRILRFNYFDKPQDISDADRELYLKSPAGLSSTLKEAVGESLAEEAIRNTAVLSSCHVVFPDSKHYPVIPGALQEFDRLVREGREKKIEDGVWSPVYESRLGKELKIIKEMGFVDYHMVVRDICHAAALLGKIPKKRMEEFPADADYPELERWIRENAVGAGPGIGPGRGSAVGSLVCFLLGITSLDPVRYGLYFERFLNPERVSMPDIDTDVQKFTRPFLIRYLQAKYGKDAVCSIMTENTYAAKSAILMAGRERSAQLYSNLGEKEKIQKMAEYREAFTLPLTKTIANDTDSLATKEDEITGQFRDSPEIMLLFHRAKLLEGKLQAVGLHAGGVVISDNADICSHVPLSYNLDKKVWAAQCDMVQIEKKGLLKIDILGLNTLDIIADTIRLVEKYRGIQVHTAQIPFEDEVFQHIYAKGYTNSVFQMEGTGAKSILKRMKPDCIEDIIIVNAVNRPGPLRYIDGIIQAKHTGKQEVSCLTRIPGLSPILSPTYGFIIYQEQVMQIFQKLAGYSLGQSDNIRRHMSKKHGEELKIERKAFLYGDEARGIPGCHANGIDTGLADELFDQMSDFAKYAFNKSHAAAYAVLSYQTAWLKYHYTPEFLCAMFNDVDQSEYAPVFEDCRLFHVPVLPPDINHSQYYFTVEGHGIRYGYKGISGIGEANRVQMEMIFHNRRGGYTSVQDFFLKNIYGPAQVGQSDNISFPIQRGTLETMAACGAFDGICKDRRSVAGFFNSIFPQKAFSSIAAFTRALEQAPLEPGRPDIHYNFLKEMDLMGEILSVDVFSGYSGPEAYGCQYFNDMQANTDGSIFGFVYIFEDTKSKKGNDMVKAVLKEKDGNTVTVYLTLPGVKQFLDCGGKYKYKILKFYGKKMDSCFLAQKIYILGRRDGEFFLKLKGDEVQNFSRLRENMEKVTMEEGGIPVHILCAREGKLISGIRYFTKHDLEVARREGFQITMLERESSHW